MIDTEASGRAAETSDVHVMMSSRDLDDYDILATMTLSVAVPYKTTESFRKLIWAAMATYGFGNSSVDHVMRRYGFLWDKRADKSFQRDPRIVALREIAETINEIAGALDQVKPAPQLGPVCAKAALCRLEASFKAAYGLVRKEYIFETDAVVRLILEQLAWAFAVHSVPDEQVLRLPPTKCIGRLKALFPECGVLYGILTEWAHIDPSLAQNYLEFHKGGVDVIRRSEFNSFESGAHIAALAPVYLEVAQRLFSPLTPKHYGTVRDRLVKAREQYDSPHEAQTRAGDVEPKP